MARAGAAGCLQIPKRMGAQPTLPAEHKAADTILLEAGDQHLLLALVIGGQQGDRVSGLQAVELLMGRRCPTGASDGGDGDMIEGIGGRQQEAAIGRDGGVGGAARERRRARLAEPAIHANPVADERKIGPYGGMEPVSVRADHQRLDLARGVDHLQWRELSAPGQGEHVDLLAGGARHINDLLHLLSTPCHGQRRSSYPLSGPLWPTLLPAPGRPPDGP